MTDTSGASAARSPSAAYADPAPSRRYAAGSDSGSAFDAALRDAGRHGVEREEEPSARRLDQREEDDKRKARKGGAEPPPPPTSTSAKGALPAGALHVQAKSPDKQGKADILGGLTQHPGGTQQAQAVQAPAGADAVDPAAFAQMVEQAAARAETLAPNQTLQVRFTDGRSPLEGAAVTRLADGTLGVTLTAGAQAAPEVSKTLETLRRRLEAKGVALGDLKLAEEGDLAPDAVQGADGG